MTSSTTRSGLSLAARRSGLVAVRGGVHVEAREPQARREQLADVRLVVDDEQACLGSLGHRASVARNAGNRLTTR